MKKIKGILFISIIFISYLSTAQKAKKDTYLDSLARKIQFKYKELFFREGSLKAIKEIAAYIKKNENYYSIESHTCRQGNQKNNQIITDKRAILIEKLLVKLGVKSSKIHSIGYGENNQCCTTKTRATRYLNRRIEIKKITEEEIKNLKSRK